MSSSFTAAEQELAIAALEGVSGNDLRVLVGGLGLGYTAREVLRDDRVSQMTVVDAIAPVISWHRRGLVPLGLEVSGDGRTSLFEGDFFDLVRQQTGPCAESAWDAVIVDIDHSPRHTLAPGNEWLYTDAGTRALAALLDDRGVFALWSNDPPDEEYLRVLRGTFAHVSSRIVSFANPLQDGVATNTVYVAQAGEK